MIQARNLVPAIGDYSTSEQDTGFTWVDGKHIYKKTINFGSLPNSTYKYVDHDISNLDKVIDIRSVATNSNAVNFLPLPLVYESGSAAYNTTIEVNDRSIKIASDRDRSSYTAYVTLYYTKTS